MTMADLPKLTPIESSSLNGYHYDPNSRVLTVQFSSGAHYSYDDVSAERVEALSGAKSPGGYFAAKIRDQHKATKLG